MKLTAAQAALLVAARARTFSDGSGQGAFIHGNQTRSAIVLKAMGLITQTLPQNGSIYGYARITSAGRTALEGRKQ